MSHFLWGGMKKAAFLLIGNVALGVPGIRCFQMVDKKDDRLSMSSHTFISEFSCLNTLFDSRP